MILIVFHFQPELTDINCLTCNPINRVIQAFVFVIEMHPIVFFL